MDLEQRRGHKNIVFYIEEGENIKLTDVVLTGNKAIPAEDIKNVMKNQEHWLFSWAGTSGTLRSEDLKEDVESIRNLYYNRGYIQVQVSDPVIEERPYTEHTYMFPGGGQYETYVTTNEVALRIHIQEGDQFNVGSVTLKGNTSITSDDLLGELRLRR